MNRFIPSRWRSWLLLSALAVASVTHAQTVSITYSASRLYNATGTTLPSGSLVLLVADTGQNGFGSLQAGSSLSLGSFLNGDDQILGSSAIFSSNAGDTLGAAFDLPLASGSYSSLTVGDALALIWFSLVTTSSTSLSAGDAYGLYSSATLDDGGYAWVIPSAGSTIDLRFRTTLSSGTHAETEGRTSLTVTAVPEPATYAIFFGALILGLTIYRRRNTK